MVSTKLTTGQPADRLQASVDDPSASAQQPTGHRAAGSNTPPIRQPNIDQEHARLTPSTVANPSRFSLVAAHQHNLSAQQLLQVLNEIAATRQRCEVIDLSGCYLPYTVDALADASHPINEALQCLGGLNNLHTLVMRRCRLQGVPAAIGSLGRLRHLDLGDNAIGDLPDIFSRMQQLRGLVVDNNLMAQLPQQLADLPHLTHIFAPFNFIDALPPTLAQRHSAGRLRLSWQPRSEMADR